MRRAAARAEVIVLEALHISIQSGIDKLMPLDEILTDDVHVGD